jgi:predicted membrane protein
VDTAVLLWGILFSSIGMGFFIYGKKQKATIPLVCGILLMIYPFFISSTTLLVIVGMILTAIPYVIRH